MERVVGRNVNYSPVGWLGSYGPLSPCVWNGERSIEIPCLFGGQPGRSTISDRDQTLQ